MNPLDILLLVPLAGFLLTLVLPKSGTGPIRVFALIVSLVRSPSPSASPSDSRQRHRGNSSFRIPYGFRIRTFTGMSALMA